jgi:hypothetical protein
MIEGMLSAETNSQFKVQSASVVELFEVDFEELRERYDNSFRIYQCSVQSHVLDE